MMSRWRKMGQWLDPIEGTIIASIYHPFVISIPNIRNLSRWLTI